MNKLLHFVNLVLLKMCKRYLHVYRYFPDDGLWAFRKQYFGTATIQDRLYRLLERKEFCEIGILQIGAHNGVDNNSVSMFSLAGLDNTTVVLVEPHPKMFAELSENYSSYDNVKCLNVAIGEIVGVQPFFTVSESSSLPEWTNQLSTFDKQQILKFAPDLQGIEDNIVETLVDCLTFDYVVRKELKNGVDVVLIDVEGFDAKIVRSIPLNAYRPSIISFEHKHLTSSDFIDVIGYLAQYGYSFSHQEYDTLAYIDS